MATQTMSDSALKTAAHLFGPDSVESLMLS
jgi:hypothetical protein